MKTGWSSIWVVTSGNEEWKYCRRWTRSKQNRVLLTEVARYNLRAFTMNGNRRLTRKKANDTREIWKGSRAKKRMGCWEERIGKDSRRHDSQETNFLFFFDFTFFCQYMILYNKIYQMRSRKGNVTGQRKGQAGKGQGSFRIVPNGQAACTTSARAIMTALILLIDSYPIGEENDRGRARQKSHCGDREMYHSEDHPPRTCSCPLVLTCLFIEPTSFVANIRSRWG